MLLLSKSRNNEIKKIKLLTSQCSRFCPDSVNMLTECGLLHLKVGQIQQAVEKLRSALALDPTYKKALLAIGYITQVCLICISSLKEYYSSMIRARSKLFPRQILSRPRVESSNINTPGGLRRMQLLKSVDT